MSPHLICILYANMSPAGLAGPPSVRLWIEKLPSSRPGAPNPPGLDKVPWQRGEQVYWLEMAEPTIDNVLEEIDRVLERGYGYRVLVGATRERTGTLQRILMSRCRLVKWSHSLVTGISAFGGQRIR